MEKVMKNQILTVKLLAAVLFSVPVLFFSFKTESHKKHSNYTVTFINKYWANMHLQVRVGNNSQPENNPLFYDKNLPRNTPLPIGYDVLCWYRRDANPDRPDGVHFTNWTSTGCFRGSPCTVDNP